MARRRYQVDPDYVVDADRGSGPGPMIKQAAVLERGESQERAATRAGARDLDRMVESSPGLSRQQRDRERAMPRDVTGDVPHPAMERRIFEPDAIRLPMSSRQRKARSVTKRAVQERLPQTQYTAVSRLISDPQRWSELNDGLSHAAGDVQELDDLKRAQVQRVDRAIQAYESANDRGHVVYANVRMPAWINHSNLEGFTRHSFPAGTQLAFDRYTGAAHTMHQVELDEQQAQRTIVFEIQTRRGAYLGRSDSIEDTAHLLPRGLRLQAVGAPHVGRYRTPDGSIRSRYVVQLVDIDTQAPTEERN